MGGLEASQFASVGARLVGDRLGELAVLQVHAGLVGGVVGAGDRARRRGADVAHLGVLRSLTVLLVAIIRQLSQLQLVVGEQIACQGDTRPQLILFG